MRPRLSFLLDRSPLVSTQYAFYMARATEARQAADAAMLDNVRDRCLRSEAAWAAMAERALRTEKARSDRADAAASAA